jgi:acyl-lipid omega-6 desaturase (Delta-12 desaturase)
MLSKQIEDVDKVNEELLKSDLARYLRPSRPRSIWQLANTILPYLILWAVAYWAMQYSFLLALPVILLASGFLVRIFIIFHDCVHRSFFKSSRANHIWGVITGILTFTPYYHWRYNHEKHHQTSGNLDKRGFGDIWTMTVEEYNRSSRTKRLKYRLYRNPFVMFLLGPFSIVLFSFRFAGIKASRKERNSVYGTNLMLLLMAVSLSLLMGWKTYLVIQSIILFTGVLGGVWLFYVQHQFEGTYWAREGEWNFITASLAGGSFFKLPAVLNWFTGSIGYHHVHHLLDRIPNYNLAKCHKEIPVLQETKPIKMFSSLKSLAYRLWDEDKGRLVGFREAKRWRFKRQMIQP